MKFSESWLRSMVATPLAGEPLAHLLTMAGLEVEAMEPVAPAFSGVVVAEVRAVEKHPNADRLRLCQVDAGGGPIAIVCGAPNVVVGMKVPCALVGAVLPGIEIKRAKVRGVESSGMLCSARELGLSDDAAGLMALPADAPVGRDVREYLELDDRLLTLKLTPNRSDCLGIAGLAREVAALTGAAVTLPKPMPVASVTSDRVVVLLEAGAACPRYCGRVIRGVNVKAATPGWMRRRLERCGVRPISAVVDVTNYVMLELGQPLHAFDLAQLSGAVRVRHARAGEHIRLLDGRDVALAPEHLLIADDARPLALAGVMGGDASGIGDDTVDIFLEGAHFHPEAVAAASRGLGIASDAAHRFERGVDFEAPAGAIERATALVLELCGGRPGPLTEARGALPERKPVRLRPARANRVMGLGLPDADMSAMLERLGFSVSREAGDLIAVPPSFRFDVGIEEDLIEELVRVHGYENVVPTLPVVATRMLALPEDRRDADAMRCALAARDYLEVVTMSFVDRDWERDFAGEAAPAALANPIASQMSVMRSTLFGSLVDVVRFNLARRSERVRVFEVAACFRLAGEGYSQTMRIGAAACGSAWPEQWGAAGRRVDLFDIRADIEALAGASRSVTFEPHPHPALHPGQSARVHVDGIAAGFAGVLHPGLQAGYELPEPVVLFELDLSVMTAAPLPAFRGVPRQVPVRRDLAFVVDEAVSSESVLATLRAGAGPLVTDVGLFDVYRGTGVPEGRKSLAFRVLLQDTEKTLTDAEVEDVVRQMSAIVQEKHKGQLRS